VDPGSDPVPAMRFGGPLPSQHRADILPSASIEPLTLTVVAVYTLYRLGHVGRGTDEPFDTRRPCTPTGCIKSVEWFAFLSHSRFVTVEVSSETEDLSLLVEFSVTYIPRPVAHLF